MIERDGPSQIGFNKFGVGSTDLSKKHRTLGLADKNSRLHHPDEELTQAHLDNLIAISLILDMHDGKEAREKMIYFGMYSAFAIRPIF